MNKSKEDDAELEHPILLTNKHHLNLSNTSVSDAGLEHLKGLTNLQVLDLDDTQVTDAGVEMMENAIGDHLLINIP